VCVGGETGGSTLDCTCAAAKPPQRLMVSSHEVDRLTLVVRGRQSNTQPSPQQSKHRFAAAGGLEPARGLGLRRGGGGGGGGGAPAAGGGVGAAAIRLHVNVVLLSPGGVGHGLVWELWVECGRCVLCTRETAAVYAAAAAAAAACAAAGPQPQTHATSSCFSYASC